jgi:hypothetical protein
MPVQKQSSQIAQFRGRHPNRWKAVFYQQLQNQIRISPIVFLLSRLSGANLCRMADHTFDSQLSRQVQKPLHRSGRFNAHAHWVWKFGIKLPHTVAFVQQSYICDLPGGGIQHRQRLLASV